MTLPNEAEAHPPNQREYETAGREILLPMVFDFVAGGNANEVTVRGIRAAFDRWRLPRVLRDHRVRTTGAEGANRTRNPRLR